MIDHFVLEWNVRLPSSIYKLKEAAKKVGDSKRETRYECARVGRRPKKVRSGTQCYAAPILKGVADSIQAACPTVAPANQLKSWENNELRALVESQCNQSASKLRDIGRQIFK